MATSSTDSWLDRWAADPLPPATWDRLTRPDLPRGVTLLSIPSFGGNWYHRRFAYWRQRALLLVLFGGMAFLQLWIGKVILWNVWHAGADGLRYWVALAVYLAATADGLAAWLRGRSALAAARDLSAGPGRTLAAAAATLLLVLAGTVAPGLMLMFTLDLLRPRTRNERIARADLEEQLAKRRGRA
ncbi:hypothetical protein [Streptacidiphilus sp. PAMC 29251]